MHAIDDMELAHINLPVAALIWAMILPVLLKIDYSALHEACASGANLALNRLVKPFSMALLRFIFLHILFADWQGPMPLQQTDTSLYGQLMFTLGEVVHAGDLPAKSAVHQ